MSEKIQFFKNPDLHSGQDCAPGALQQQLGVSPNRDVNALGDRCAGGRHQNETSHLVRTAQHQLAVQQID